MGIDALRKGRIKSIIQLTRPHQWYKNTVIFLAILFSRNFFNIGYLAVSVLGFLVLILVSSANYIFNDLIDLRRDRLNPEKKGRPLVSGEVDIYTAIFLLVILSSVGLIGAYLLDIYFFFAVLAISITSTVYTVY